MALCPPRTCGGKRLVGLAIRSSGAVTVDVNEANGQAVGFYRHLGFMVVGLPSGCFETPKAP